MRFEHRVAVIDDSGNEVGTMPIDEFTKIASGFERYITVAPHTNATPPSSKPAKPPKPRAESPKEPRSRRIGRNPGAFSGAFYTGSKSMALYEALDENGTLTRQALKRATGFSESGLAGALTKGRRLGRLAYDGGAITITDKGRSALAAAQGRLQ